jgi:lipase maturation factor 1
MVAMPDSRRVAVPPARPLLLFDGKCAFCRVWIARWKAMTGDRVDYAPS